MARNLQFTGSLTGDDITVEVTQSGVTKSRRVASWGTPTNSSASLSIALVGDREAPSAPEPFLLRADFLSPDVGPPTPPNTYDPRIHEVFYSWTITKDGSPWTDTYEHLSVPAALGTNWNNKGKHFGWAIYFVASEPGVYAITCVGTDEYGNAATSNTLSLTVADPDTVYTDADTFWLHDGDTSDIPGGASNVYSNISTWLSALNAHVISTGKGRGRMARDGEWTILALNAPNMDPADWRLIDAFGTGTAKPLIRPETNSNQGASISNDGGNLIFSKIELRGLYNALTEVTTATKYTDGFATNGLSSTVQKLVFDNVTIQDSTGSGINLLQSGYRCWVYDCLIWNNGNFGIYANAAGLGIKGSKIGRAPEALPGGGNEQTVGNAAGDRDGNRHGPIRVNAINSGNVYELSDCYLYSASGHPYGGAAITPQGLVRTLTGSAGGREVNMNRIIGEGAELSLGSGTASSAYTRAQNMVLDGFVIVGSGRKNTDASSNDTGCTIRNGLIVMVDTASTPVSREAVVFSYLETQQITPSAVDLDQPVRGYNNTVIDYRRSGRIRGNWSGQHFGVRPTGMTNVQFGNNAIYAPNLDGDWSPITSDFGANIDLVTALYTPVFKFMEQKRLALEYPGGSNPNASLLGQFPGPTRMMMTNVVAADMDVFFKNTSGTWSLLDPSNYTINENGGAEAEITFNSATLYSPSGDMKFEKVRNFTPIYRSEFDTTDVIISGRPLAGAAVIADCNDTLPCAINDITMNLRPTTRSARTRGAWEPAA